MSGDIDDDRELGRDLLSDVYNSIKNEPFKIPVDDGDDIMLTFFNPDREGWLSKQGSTLNALGPLPFSLHIMLFLSVPPIDFAYILKLVAIIYHLL